MAGIWPDDAGHSPHRPATSDSWSPFIRMAFQLVHAAFRDPKSLF
jgi:hypothetical protein